MYRKGIALPLAAACSVLVLAMGCQPAQPAATPKPVEKVAATATKPAEKPIRGGTLRIAAGGDFASLDPNTQTAQNAFYSLYENLIEPDKDSNLTKGGLAKDWSVGSDGKSMTFKLREGVKFQDGTDFDAAAVKFNVDRMRDPASRSPFREYYVRVASVDVVDSLTVRFNLSQPDVLILPRLGGAAGGLMVSPAAVKKHGQDFPRNPVGSGPFQFVEWVAGDHVTYKRFEGYWKKDQDGGQLPYLDRVVYQILPDPTTALANLRTGQADVMSNIPLDQQPLVKNDPSLMYQTQPQGITAGTLMNTKRPPFDNKALRQAVALAVDRQGMANVTGSTMAVSLINPVDKAFDDGVAAVFPARDVAKAKAKMAEAGYPAGGLKVKYTAQTGGIGGVQIAEITKANLAEIGIEVEIEILAGAAFNTKVRASPWDYQISQSFTNIAVGDPGHYLGNMFHSQGSRNWFGPYSNPQVDQALDKAVSTYDQKERAALYQQTAKAIVEDAIFVSLFVPNNVSAVSKKVRNLVQYKLDNYNRTWDAWLAQ